MMGEALAAIGLISFREGLEAAVLVALIVAVLKRLGRERFVGVAFASALASVALGVRAGWAVLRIYGGLPEKEIFEGAMSLVAAGLVTTVILWMAKTGPRMAGEIESRLSVVGSAAGVAVFTFIAVSREALETVLMSTPYLVRDPAGSLAGLALGAGSALLLASAIYAFGVILIRRKTGDLKKILFDRANLSFEVTLWIMGAMAFVLILQDVPSPYGALWSK